MGRIAWSAAFAFQVPTSPCFEQTTLLVAFLPNQRRRGDGPLLRDCQYTKKRLLDAYTYCSLDRRALASKWLDTNCCLEKKKSARWVGNDVSLSVAKLCFLEDCDPLVFMDGLDARDRDKTDAGALAQRLGG